jgi:hypothetical protein
MSLSKVWNENERFSLVFTKMLVFVPKTGSLHTGTGYAGRAEGVPEAGRGFGLR